MLDVTNRELSWLIWDLSKTAYPLSGKDNNLYRTILSSIYEENHLTYFDIVSNWF